MTTKTIPSRVKAHRKALPVSAQDLSGELSRVLGRQLVAFIVGKDARTVLRWTNGETKPSVTEEAKLRDAFQVYLTLTPVDGANTIRAWFMGMNPELDDESPAEVLAAGRARDAMAAARMYLVNG